MLGWNAVARGDYGEARRLYEEAAEAHSGPGDEQLQRRALMALASVDVPPGRPRPCRQLASRRRREHAARRVNPRPGACTRQPRRRAGRRRRDGAGATVDRGEHRAAAGRTPASRFSQSRLCNLGYMLRPTDPVEALAHFSESLTLAREIEEPRTIAYCLEGGAGILAARGNPTNATTLLAAASAIRALTGAVSSPRGEPPPTSSRRSAARRCPPRPSPEPGRKALRSTPTPPPTGRSDSWRKAE